MWEVDCTDLQEGRGGHVETPWWQAKVELEGLRDSAGLEAIKLSPLTWRKSVIREETGD